MTELLTASPWFHMRSTSQVGGVTMEAPYSSYHICVKDDPYTFAADGKQQINQGILRCPGEADYLSASMAAVSVDEGEELTDFYSHR